MAFDLNFLKTVEAEIVIITLLLYRDKEKKEEGVELLHITYAPFLPSL